MAYITAQELAGHLPRDGDGVSVSQMQGAVAAAVEEIAGVTGDTTGDSALTRQAVVNLALAELFDTVIYPGDARRPGSESSALRTSASRALSAFERIKTDEDKDFQPDVPNAVVTYLDF